MRTQLATTTTNHSHAETNQDSVHRDRLISCRDVGDRRREVTVFTDHQTARVVLVAPPGETAYLDLPSARQLRATRDDLITDTEHELAITTADADGAAAAVWKPPG